MYSAGDCVIYGIHGVCRVVGTEKQMVNRKRTEYLVLEPMNQTESRFYLPTANPAAMVKLKQVISREAWERLLVSDEIRRDNWIRDENQRKQHYRDLISNGDRISILKMVAALYRYKEEQLAAGRKFHLSDDNFLRDAEKLLASELALVMEIPADQARDYLREQLKK
ncbi:MAG: hypothetical protein IKJ99_01550 [Oscillospiraceae bacterium]|nr:hypothetical protein [Oscillospiraceae bacterium]